MTNKTDSFAFYVGKAVESFDGSTENIKSVDFSQYVNRAEKTIKSQTGELFWNYKDGILQIDAPAFQGAVGFMEGMTIALTNVTVDTKNDYVTVACASMDGLPLAESARILVQVMTEDCMKGYKTEGSDVSDLKIVSVGEPPYVVRDIEVTLTFTGVKSRFVSRLDENGYAYSCDEIDGDGEFTINLGKDGMYTILSVEKPDGEIAAYKEKASENGFWEFTPEKDSCITSPMDLRSLNENVAGESGFVSRDGDEFILADGTPVRFWAVNAGPAIVKGSKEEVSYLARRLSKMGVNMVRIHGSVMENSDKAETLEDLKSISDEYLDSYHYFVYAMKMEGIYTKLSYYFPLWVRMKPSFNVAGFEGKYEGKHPFALLQYDKRFQDVYKSWAEKILLSVNPYTGVQLAKEPAVAMIEIQNEDSYLFGTFTRSAIPDEQFNIIGGYFRDYLVKKYGSAEGAYAAWGADCGRDDDCREDGDCDEYFVVRDIYYSTTWTKKTESQQRRSADQMQFLTEFQKQFYHDMYDYYRNTIGTPILISASNWMTAEPKTMEGLERYTYTATDVIDRHGYFEENHTGDRSSWSVREGHTLSNITALKNPDKAIVQMNRVKGYPHIITETAWPAPNRFTGECVPMWTIFGALQGVNGIFMFCLGALDWEKNPHMKWPVLVPSVIGQFPAFALMYRNRLIKEADVVTDVTYNLQELYASKGMPLYETSALDNLRKENL